MVGTHLPRPPTRSTITATTSNDAHELTVEGYSVTKLFVPGEKIDTPRFTAAGYSWKISYYPNRVKETDGSISFFLKMADDWKFTGSTSVRVEFAFSLVPRQGAEPAARGVPAAVRFAGKHRVVSFPHKEKGDVAHWGLSVSKRDLEKSPEYLHDDSFVLRCKIAVVDKPVVKRHHGPPVCRCKDDLCKLNHLKGASWLKDAIATYFLDCLGI